ncbi:WhiB family transcriptional regulator [Nocardia terpenica]|uniref:WhiB family transcriptional regulator n=1 Tax=Nocardia terpenica TaxID=455432 RepID=UPI0018944959|nr:WhiB family transcriptional regulator [Nocardia terpenica]MBF6060560.1 WhiB family transcriptional regulator [Nocardia terpenica]MBF6103820.1 WhiB family transcriptional regulator [Nocardia terpenica]MBF6111806.1 WhiB family transcriptional regulator [Nocardia terpenica]MBF6118041.1 WhiB family transcriptional regulator [Nocardia terpenica]MBF6155233.1 WhiB family transcriptional regulator [Nocardia terpenica]
MNNNPFRVGVPVAAGWQDRALCKDRNPAYWATESLPVGRDRDRVAAARCRGCPVLRECAAWHCRQPRTVGVVVAGIAVGTDGGHLTSAGDQARLARIAYGTQPPPILAHQLRHCAAPDCRQPMLTSDDHRKAGHPTQFRVYGALGLCSRCYQRRRYHLTKPDAPTRRRRIA